MLFAERRAYLAAIQENLAGLYEARVTLVQAQQPCAMPGTES